jgi:hypothetical protein
LNIPARYCTFLDGRWFTFDARHSHPRIIPPPPNDDAAASNQALKSIGDGSRGTPISTRYPVAADVAISTAFGPTQLVRFQVVTEEVANTSADQKREAAV